MTVFIQSFNVWLTFKNIYNNTGKCMMQLYWVSSRKKIVLATVAKAPNFFLATHKSQ